VRQQTDTERGSNGVTWRALLIGGAASLFIGAAVPYSNMVIKGTVLAHNFSVPAALFVFFVLVAGMNPLLHLCHPRLALHRAELAVIFIMAMIATSIPTIGFSEYVLPIISGLYYYASPENDWANLIHPHVPRWIAPRDPAAIRYFYEGLPEGMSIPWDAWVVPLSWWCVFVLALFWMSICTMVILRRQWMENEKLLYPLVQVPLEMIQDDGPPRAYGDFFRSSVMWLGFAIPFFIGSVNALNAYFEYVPRIETFAELHLFRETTYLRLDLNLALLGFAYLLSRDVAFGFWVFFLLSVVQRGIFNIIGLQSGENLSRFANLVGPYMAHQAMGAMIVLVLSGLWMARDHLRGVFARAFGDDAGADDADEIISYRTAVLGLFIGVAILAGWLWKSGLPLWTVFVFLFAVFVVFLALTRAVVEGGISVLRTPLTPVDFVISGVGTTALGASGLMGVAFAYVWSANVRIFFMACFANALKLAEEIKGSRRPLLGAVILAVLLAMFSSLWLIIEMAYSYGGINLHGFFFVSVPQNAFNFVAPKFGTPVPVSWDGWGFTAIGGAIMAVLTWLRYTYVWWPLHPLGFATGTFYIMNWLWFSVFLAWLLKSIILKYGGSGWYLMTRPFFLGLILGQVVVAGTWLVIDTFTGMTGNVIGYF
jgi:hypothetical protein